MSNSYKISFSALRQERLQNVFIALENAFRSLSIDFYLVGALARDTWLAQNGIRALGTKDVDIAVFIANEHKFEELKEFLIEKEGFTKSINWNVLFDRHGQQIDLLPFGAIDMDGKKLIGRQDLIYRDVSGFKEVYENAIEEVEFEGLYQFKVSTLAGIVILKLIAYDDRPEMRSNDIKDIGFILSHYFDLESDLIYESHADLFSDEGNSLEQIAARVLGRQMQAIIDKNRLLKGRIEDILQKGTVPSTENRMAIWLLNAKITTIEQAIGLIGEVITGLNEELPA